MSTATPEQTTCVPSRCPFRRAVERSVLHGWGAAHFTTTSVLDRCRTLVASGSLIQDLRQTQTAYKMEFVHVVLPRHRPASTMKWAAQVELAVHRS